MRALLQIKAFSLFLLVAGPFVFLVIPGAIFKILHLNYADELSTIGEYASLVSTVIAYCWYYVLAVELHKKLPPDQPMRLGTFKILLVLGILVWIFQQFLVELLSDTDSISAREDALWFVYLLTFASVAFGVAIDVWLARALTAVENQRAVKWGDYYGTFFTFLFYIIGVFWIQPGVNKIFSEDSAVDPDMPIDRL